MTKAKDIQDFLMQQDNYHLSTTVYLPLVHVVSSLSCKDHPQYYLLLGVFPR
jgi:hypothetical protein